MPVLLLPLAMSVTSPLLPLAASYGAGGGGGRNVTIVSILCDDETSTDGGRLRRENREVRAVLKERRGEEAFVRNRRMSVFRLLSSLRYLGPFLLLLRGGLWERSHHGNKALRSHSKVMLLGENVIFVVHHAGEGRKTE